MKKKLVYLSISVLTVFGCDLDINENPNYPESGDVTATLIFPAIENSIATVVGDAMFNYAGFFAQYFEQRPEANQYNDISELKLQETSQLIDRSYSVLYAGALQDVEDVKSKTNNPADIFAATVLRAYAFQLLVDNMNDAPYSEALQGSANASPKWDDGETIYKGVLAEMDAAEAELSGSDAMECTDPLLNKNVKQWIGFANALRLRMYMRLVDGNIDASANTEKVRSLVQNNDFFTGNIAFDVYSNLEGQYNPWFGSYFSLGTINHCAAYPIISYMSQTDDPRISYAFNTAEATDTYVGQMPGAKAVQKEWAGSWLNRDVSAANYNTTRAMPVYLFSQSELQFYIAEVQLRFMNNVAAAKSAYQAAITADFASRDMGGQETAFMAGSLVNWDNASGSAEQLKLIYTQKWVAFLYRNHIEAWSEIRRTDCPPLSPASGKDIYANPLIYNAGDMISPTENGLGSGLAKRTHYPRTARQLNPNTPPASSMATPVFWDKN